MDLRPSQMGPQPVGILMAADGTPSPMAGQPLSSPPSQSRTRPTGAALPGTPLACGPGSLLCHAQPCSHPLVRQMNVSWHAVPLENIAVLLALSALICMVPIANVADKCMRACRIIPNQINAIAQLCKFAPVGPY